MLIAYVIKQQFDWESYQSLLTIVQKHVLIGFSSFMLMYGFQDINLCW